MQNRKHQEHGAQQKLVGDGIEVLAQRGLLFQSAREQAIEAITKSCQHKQGECPGIMTADKINNNERQKHHAQQRELVRSS